MDGTGSPGRRADVGVLGDRILAIDDLSVVDAGDVTQVIDARGLVVAPGFIDPHRHSDGSLFVDGALVSHLRQGSRPSCRAIAGTRSRRSPMPGGSSSSSPCEANQLVARWRTFDAYLDAVAAESLGLNVAFLVGRGTVRGAVMGPEATPASEPERAAMVREVEAALEAGAFGLSSGLIYAPGIHADSDELVALVSAATRRGGLYATHMRNEGAGLFASLAESIATVRSAREAGGAGARLQISHLKCGARVVWGRAGATPCWSVPTASTWPPTNIRTGRGHHAATILPPSLLGLGVEECVALADHEVRDRVVAEMERGISGWENVAADRAGRVSASRSLPAIRTGRVVPGRPRCGAGRRSRGSRSRCPGRRPPGRVGRHRVHGRRRCRGDHGRALDRCLHRRGGRRPGHPDPRRRGAASAHVREHGIRPRDVRARAEHAHARDGDRQAQRRVRRASGAARPGRASRGRIRGPRRPRPGHGRGRRDL